jgi:hypothetical protein
MATRDREQILARGTVRDDALRQRLVLEIVRYYHGRTHPDDGIPPVKREGTIRHRSGTVLSSPYYWFPVTAHEVRRARLRALRAGVTFGTYMHFHLLRRNYEADPNDLRRGAWIKVRRAPPPCMPFALLMAWRQAGCGLIDLIDDPFRLEDEFGVEAAAIELAILDLLSDLCRPLYPRRSHKRRRPVPAQG